MSDWVCEKLCQFSFIRQPSAIYFFPGLSALHQRYPHKIVKLAPSGSGTIFVAKKKNFFLEKMFYQTLFLSIFKAVGVASHAAK
jgi:hypothetical protein